MKHPWLGIDPTVLAVNLQWQTPEPLCCLQSPWETVLYECISFHMPGWLRFLGTTVAAVAIRPSVSRSRTLYRLIHWLTRGYELLKVSLTTHGMWAEFPTAEDMYDLICGSRSTVWPPCLFFSFQHVMSGQCCLDRISTMTSIASDTRQSSATGNHLCST